MFALRYLHDNMHKKTVILLDKVLDEKNEHLFGQNLLVQFLLNIYSSSFLVLRYRKTQFSKLKKLLKLGLYEMEFFSHQILCRVLLQENNSKSLQMYVWSSNEIMSATIFLDLPHIAKGILWLLQIVRKICCMYNEKGEKKVENGVGRFYYATY